MPEIVRLEKSPHDPMQLYASRFENPPAGTVAIPCRDQINARTVSSIITTNFKFAIEQGQSVDVILLQGNVLTWQRNACIDRMRGDWILFIDDDMIWQPDAIAKLVALREEHDLDMVGGLCFRRAEPYQPTLYMRERPDDGGYNYLETWPEDELVEVDASGLAFMLIHKRVFEMIAGGPMPPFEVRQQQGGVPNFFRWEGSLGEDLRFCQDAKAAGAKIWVATGVQIGHAAEVQIDHSSFLAAVARRDPAYLVARREINDQMGLPTMTPDEAKERLGWG